MDRRKRKFGGNAIFNSFKMHRTLGSRRQIPIRHSRSGGNAINYVSVCQKKSHYFSRVKARNASEWDEILPNDILWQRICFIRRTKFSVEICATSPGTDR
jgi:hypothetical protein